MSDFTDNINIYIDEAKIAFELNKGENLLEFNGTSYYGNFINIAFTCRFLSDCIEKGISSNRAYLEENIKVVASKASTEDPQIIIKDFDNLAESKDLIIILAYEGILTYLIEILTEVLRKNHNRIKSNEFIEYKIHDLVDRIGNDALLIDDLINYSLFKSKERGNTSTRPEYWIKILEEKFEICLNQNQKDFWGIVHIRRNSSSHADAKKHWLLHKKEIKDTSHTIWIYSLIKFIQEIDFLISQKYSLKTSKCIKDMSGKPFYNFN